MSRTSQIRRSKRGRGLSPSRLAILEMIEGQPDPITLPSLVQHSGLHENTVRGHLEQLLADGYITRSRGIPSGRGRPAWLWTAAANQLSAEANDYAQLASVLAKTISDTSPNPLATAQQAGQDWGQKIAKNKNLKEQSSAAGSGGETAPRTILLELLDDLGFSPKPLDGESEVELQRCPLLQTATEHPEIVCNVHLGLLHGAAQEVGVDALDSTLTPFASPGVCALHLSLTQTQD